MATINHGSGADIIVPVIMEQLTEVLSDDTPSFQTLLQPMQQ